MATQANQRCCDEIMDLHHAGEGKFFVQPKDYDAFVMTQREAVEALRDHKKTISWLEEIKGQIDSLFMDLAKWGKESGAAKIIWGPRRDEGFFAVVAPDEDEDGALQDRLADLEFDLNKKYRFRLSFIMFRASEADGVESFVQPDSARIIFRAATPGPSNQG